MSEDQRSKTYQKLKHRIFFISLCLDIIFLSFLWGSGLSTELAAFSSRFSSNPIMINGIFLIALSAGFYILHFPLNVFTGFIWEHKHHLSTQTLGQWWKDDVKKGMLGLFVFVLLMEGVYMFLSRFPENWWIGAGAFWFLITFIMAKITPNVIVPLFFKYSPLDNECLKERITQLFKTCRVPLKEVYTVDFSKKTTKANAFVCGIGNNRRVVLSDTLLAEFSDPEIEVVVAHELGHYKQRDILKSLCVNGASIFVGLYLVNNVLRFCLEGRDNTGIDDIANFPIIAIALMIFGLVTTPFMNIFSRIIERKADAFSLEVTHNTKDFISTMEKLGSMNLAEFSPSLFDEIFFYDHPPIQKRIEFAESFRFPADK